MRPVTLLKTELKKIVHLAWPLLIAQVTQTLMGVSDTIMAGRYSATDMAGVAIGFSITMPVLFFIQGLILALPPIISRLNGAQQTEKVANATQQAFYLVFSVSLIFAVGAQLVPYLFSFSSMDEELKNITIHYTQYILLGAPAFTAYQLLRNYCEGLSITKPTMIIMVLGLAVNIPANYILIYGKFGMPELGGIGCGIATALVFVVMFLATLFYTKKSKRLADYGLFKTLYQPELTTIWQTFKLGFPIALTILFEVTLFGVVALLLSPLGANIVASHQVALNFSSIMFMFPLSIGIATSIRIAHLIGENNLQAAKKAVLGAWLLGLSIATITATITVLARLQIARLYSADQHVIELAASLMFLASLFQLSDSIQVISAGALRGYKDTAVMSYITFTAYWLLGLPIGFILALTDWIVTPMGASGFWVGFICGLSAAAVLLGARVHAVQNKLALNVSS